MKEVPLGELKVLAATFGLPVIEDLGSGSLLAYDKTIIAPTVVIHGRADKLMRPAGGRAVARAIRRSRLVMFDGMGHDLPEPLWDDIVGELKTTFAEAP